MGSIGPRGRKPARGLNLLQYPAFARSGAAAIEGDTTLLHCYEEVLRQGTLDELPVIIAAANSAYFLMTCLLMELVARFAKSCKFFALDFGLTDAERRFLRSRQALIEMPANVPGVSPAAHPYFLKTAIVRYLDAIEPSSPIVWIDGDVVLGRNIDRPLDGVLAAMKDSQSDIAACEECKIKDVLAFTGLDLLRSRRCLPGTIFRPRPLTTTAGS